MSSQFSYELDERQIKILLQDAEVEYNDVAWQKFESLQKKEVNLSFENVIPKLNINISRSIIVPIIFIILIGGFSTLLFSFVDFKKKPAIVSELPMIVVPATKNNPEPELNSKSIAVVAPLVIIKADSLMNSSLTENKKIIKDSIKPEIVEVVIEKKITQIVESKNSKDLISRKKKKRKLKSIELQSIKASNNLNEGSAEPELELR